MKKRKIKNEEKEIPKSSVLQPLVPSYSHSSQSQQQQPSIANASKIVKKKLLKVDSAADENFESAELPESELVINYSKPANSNAAPAPTQTQAPAAFKPTRTVNFTPSTVRFSTLNPLNPSFPSDLDEMPIQSFQSRFSDFHGDNDSTGLIRKLLFTTKDCQTPGRYDARQKASGQPMKVFLRIRPILEFDQLSEESSTGGDTGAESVRSFVKLEDENSICLTAPADSSAFRNGEKESKFTFSKVFPAEANQEELFNTAVLPVVDSFYSKGTNGLIFAYGITNSGKTFTMQGSASQPGIIPRVICSVFEKIFNNQKSSGAEGEVGDRESAAGGLMPHFSLSVSFLEIYNERIFDLLAISSASTGQARNECKLQHTKSDEVYVSGLREVAISNHKEALLILQQGLMNRKVGETILNSDSSRSHSVFTIKLITSDGSVWSRLSIVDLAGSERTKRTQHHEMPAAGAMNSKLREAVNINTSLLVLGRCLESLRWNQLHPRLKQKQIPFRESKITRLFRDSLTGWGQTVMICNTSQNPADYDENIHALKYAAIAREIRVMPRVDTSNVQYLAANRAKRAAEKSIMELDGENNSSIDDVDIEFQRAAQRNKQTLNQLKDREGNQLDDNEVDALLDQIFHLKQLLVATEAKCAEIDTAVRTECVNEMELQAQQFEAMNEQNLNYEKQRIQTLFDRKFNILKEEMEEKYKNKNENINSINNGNLEKSTTGGENNSSSAALDSSAGLEYRLEIDSLKSQLRELNSTLHSKNEELRLNQSSHAIQLSLINEAHEKDVENVKSLMKEQINKESIENQKSIELMKKEINSLKSAMNESNEKYEEIKNFYEDQAFVQNKLTALCEEYNQWKSNNLSLTEFLVQIRELLMGEVEKEEENEMKKNQQQFNQIAAVEQNYQSHQPDNEMADDQVDINYIQLQLNNESEGMSDGNSAPEGQSEIRMNYQLASISQTQPINYSSAAANNNSAAEPAINKTAPLENLNRFATPSKSNASKFIAAALSVLTNKKNKNAENEREIANQQQQQLELDNAINEKEKEKQRKAAEKAEKAAKKQAEKEEKDRLKAEAKARAAEEKEKKRKEKEAAAAREIPAPILAPRQIHSNNLMSKNQNPSQQMKSLDAEWLDLLSPIRPATDSSSPAVAKPQVAEKKYGKSRHRHEAAGSLNGGVLPAFQSQSSIHFNKNTINKLESNESSFTFYGDHSLDSSAMEENEQQNDKENAINSAESDDEEFIPNQKKGKSANNKEKNNPPAAKRTRAKNK